MTNVRRSGPELTHAIMRTTLELGQELGYAKLSIEAIATRAGCRQAHRLPPMAVQGRPAARLAALAQ